MGINETNQETKQQAGTGDRRIRQRRRATLSKRRARGFVGALSVSLILLTGGPALALTVDIIGSQVEVNKGAAAMRAAGWSCSDPAETANGQYKSTCTS